jgi:(1->4)-alpha-D-glucan 1-alpha-D-glucosylmutase
MPGVPDFYHGSEFWDLSLVDPDNRRPVDFAARRKALNEARDWDALADRWSDGRVKLALTQRLLRLRRDHPGLFLRGDYRPVDVAGPDSGHILAFMRADRKARLLVVAARHFASKTGGGTHWPRGGWEAALDPAPDAKAGFADVLRGGVARDIHDAAGLLGRMPVAVLVRADTE